MSADKIRPERIWIKPCDPCDRVDDYYLCDPRYLDGRETAYIRADLARPSQARDERVARLIEAAAHLLRNYLQDELYEPDLCVSDEHWAAIRDLDAALAAMDTPKGGGDE